eukprot:PhF_6_TR8491/c0_g1_i1/m.13283/K09009/K09009; uncharacterized protein
MLVQQREGTTPFGQLYAATHNAYLESVERRLTTSTEEVQQFRKVMETKYGNAGVCTPFGVKCLHAQVGMYLGGCYNPIGQCVVDDIFTIGNAIVSRGSLMDEASKSKDFCWYEAEVAKAIAMKEDLQRPNSSDRCAVGSLLSEEEVTLLCTLCQKVNRIYTGHQRHTKRRRT